MSGTDTATPRIMNPTVTVNPNGPVQWCWSPLQRTTASALGGHKGIFSTATTHSGVSPRLFDDTAHDLERTGNKIGNSRGTVGGAAVRRTGTNAISTDSLVSEEETSAVAAAIRLLESHQLLQQAIQFLSKFLTFPCCKCADAVQILN
jgi:hypothetical protein